VLSRRQGQDAIEHDARALHPASIEADAQRGEAHGNDRRVRVRRFIFFRRIPAFFGFMGNYVGGTLQFGGFLCDVADQAMIELCTLLIAFAMRVLSFHFMVNSSWLPDA
jgi:hypothetical protein